jgi:DNA primase
VAHGRQAGAVLRWRRGGQRAAMRAACAPCPCCAPAIRWDRAPARRARSGRRGQEAGQGGDGAAARRPASCSTLLWEQERDAQPLASPEDKAGLKARLMAHVEAIQIPTSRRSTAANGSIAIPPSPSRRANPPQPARPVARQRRKGQRWQGAPATVAAITERLRRATRGQRQATCWRGARRPCPLSRPDRGPMPSSCVSPGPAGNRQAVDFLLELAETLEGAGIAPISASGILPPRRITPASPSLMKVPIRTTRVRTWPKRLPCWSNDPALEAALARHRPFRYGSGRRFAEQQRLRKRKLEIESKYRANGGKRAAATAERARDRRRGTWDQQAAYRSAGRPETD